jgi:hypothetical protein
MRVLIACEFSGIVREAFRERGHDAWSCDLLPTELPGQHYQGDVRDMLAPGNAWNLMIAFPPCTYLCRSGARWHWGTPRQAEALEFVRYLMAQPMPWAIENPVGAISSYIRKPDLIVQPWQYGHRETKATCLWLHRLPPLMATDVREGPFAARVHKAPETRDRWKVRSRTLPGLAAAMAEQWSRPVPARGV